MTYYQVTNWSVDIKPVEYEKVSAKFGFLKDRYTYKSGQQRREALNSEYHRSFSTREEAVAYVHSRLIDNKAACTKKLERATAELREFENREQL